MADAARSVLLVDDGEALEAAAELLRRRGLEVRAATAAEVRESPARGPAAVAVIGPSVANPAGLARRLREGSPRLHVVFAASEDALPAMRSTLLYSAPAGTPWRLVAADPQEVVGATVALLEASRRASEVRTTLDRVNLQLAAAAPVDAQAWRRLVVSDHFLASLLRHAQDAIISLDLRGVVLSWNDGASRLFGVRRKEAIGENIDRVLRWSGSLRGLVDAAVREGFVRSELHCDVGGRELVIDATLSAIEGERSESLAVAAILRDVTERVRTQEALAENEARFRALADNIPQLAWMTDETGWITWYNRRWYEYTGTTFEQMQGWGWQAVHHPEHIGRVVEKFKAHLLSGVEWEDTFPLRSRDGGYRWFLSRAFPIRDAHGRVIHWFGTNTDVTEQRAAQEALREADRRKNEFISVLSHELRNPLAPIRNAIMLLDLVEPGSDAAVKARAVLRRQTDHLSRLVDDLLDVTRISRGKIVLAKAPMDLAGIVRAAVDDHRSLIESAGLELRQSLPSGEVWADVDGARISQVLGNLLHNALKFTPAGGHIHVAMASDGQRARIEVADSGSGIEPELLRGLFEPFVQGERSLERAKGGLGLGLAVARGVAEMHGGRITAHSEGLDRGACFRLEIPVMPAPPLRASDRPDATIAGTAGASRRVLVVDDNRDAADSLAELVALFGHEVEVAYDGHAALARVQAQSPDVVLCDLGLPGMSGFEVARSIRRTGGAMRLVAVSGYAQADDLRNAREAGFDEHVAKPPPPERIRELLGGGR